MARQDYLIKARSGCDSAISIDVSRVRRTGPGSAGTPMWLDRAAVIEKESSASNITSPWRLCSILQVEETKRIIHVIPVWATTPAGSLVFSQVQTYTILQGSTLDRELSDNFELPTTSLFSAIVLIAMITVPIYDRVEVPLASSFTKHPYGFSTLQRLGMALVFAILTLQRWWKGEDSLTLGIWGWRTDRWDPSSCP
ncbi:hypothetical protein R1sor_015686 [Riccia sorocarpa]|uniref:Uncharacterized protein n=1 Tax=Riccia sorocarpa TaxID=122646 RepID=A0ABD3HFL9_9MARC